jgi:hypothetical protein
MIRKGIELEFYRAFHNVWYFISLTIAVILVLLQFFLRVIPYSTRMAGTINIDYPYSVFNTGIMFETGSYYSHLYYFSIILLATVPYAASYFNDMKDGYIKNIAARMDIKGYLIGKYLAVFVSAGSICVIPLIINTYLTAMVIPSLLPQLATKQFSVVTAGSFAMDLFYTHPYLYTTLYLFIDFVMAGLYGCLALVISKIVNNRYIVMFFPFLIFFVFQSVIMYTPFSLLGPYYIMDPHQSNAAEEAGTVVAGIASLLIITVVGFKIAGGKKNDIL